MRVVFMGTPEFAVPSLSALVEAHDVVAVYTRPDPRAGRGRRVTPSAVKSFAHGAGLTIRQPDRFGAEEISELAASEPDVLCVAAYGTILPQAVLDIPVFGALNVHASLLPAHRGAAPIERAILGGDRQTGVSIMLMEATLDTGPVASRMILPLEDLDAVSASVELAKLGAVALLEVLPSVEDGTVVWEPQDDTLATYAKKIDKTEVALDPDLDVSAILRRVRASSRRAQSSAIVCGGRITVLEARHSDVSLDPGEVIAGPDGLHLGASDGSVNVSRLRPQNRSEMSGDAFACGLRDAPSVWTAS